MNPPRQEPVAITGLGLICNRSERSTRALRAIPPSRFISVEIPDFPLERSVGRSRRLAHIAAKAACLDGRLRNERCGASLTISKGLIERLEDGVAHPESPTLISDCGADAAARSVASAMGLGGPMAAAVAACASGLASVKLGMDWLRDGVCETVLAGAAESSNSTLILRSFERLGVISAQGFTRPFDTKRDGFVVGEGAAVFRLEAFETAQFNATRGTGPAVLGRVLGVALGADGHHLTTPDPSGAMLAHVVETALHRAGIEPGELGWIHAHGTATAYNDPVEIAALRHVFGKKMPPITATKGETGHLLGASGAVALGITLEALRGGFIPPIVGLIEPAAEFEAIDFVRDAPRVSTAKNALVLNHGFGGHIAAAVVSL